ncbi:MAG TPA: hypothetical protein VIT23_05880 [Terrimicrobiaceae bacterium]
MKSVYYYLIAMALAIGVNAQTHSPQKYPAQLTIKVVTDESSPVQDVTVGASTFGHWVQGEGFGRDIHATATAKTDKDGIAQIDLASMDGDFGVSVREAKGYYHDLGRGYRFKETKDGKWLPWNPMVNIVFKPIINPIPMFAKKLGELPHGLKLPEVGKPVGFDLMKGDWVAPYGFGTTPDLVFTFTEQIPYEVVDKPFAATLKVSFTNPLDGIQSVFAPFNEGSVLRLPRFAPEEGYMPELTKQIGSPGKDKPLNTGIREDQNYFIRVRTVLDDTGKIKSANYGKILGDIKFWGNRGAQFIYCLNPTSLDRNMEFDPKRNLFTNLPLSQRVLTP